jgi:hypothetical protein
MKRHHIACARFASLSTCMRCDSSMHDRQLTPASHAKPSRLLRTVIDQRPPHPGDRQTVVKVRENIQLLRS